MKNDTKWELLPTVRNARTVLFCCFFFSGLTGLLYEVVWVRMFTLVFGNTVYSTAAVLAAFMGGLGAGGWWFGRFIERRKDAVLFYGIVEIGVGLYALVPVFLIGRLESSYPSIYRMAGGHLSILVAIKALASAFILILPTFCMGATLPLLSRFFISQRTRFGRAVSLLYGLNTLGAVTGTFLTGFILLAVMGIRTTLLIGMVTNIGIGLLAMVQHGKLRDVEVEEDESGSPVDTSPPEPARAQEQPTAPTGAAARGYFIPLVLIGTFTAGFTSLLLEVAWTRALALILGSSVYSFTLILLTFLLGISLGSLAFGRYLRARPGVIRSNGLALLSFCFLGIAVFSSAGLPLIQQILFLFGKTVGLIQGNYTIILMLQFAVCALMLIIPTLFFGAAFPAAAALYSMRTGAVSSGVGRVYLWNTVGAIIGSALTGFVLIPVIGVHASIIVGTLAALAIGAVLLLAEVSVPALRRLVVSAAAAAIVIVIAATSSWDSRVMSSGPFLYGANFRSFPTLGSMIKNYLSRSDILYHRDGVSCTVTVFKDKIEGSTFLRVNGKTDASSGGDAYTQAFLAAMPLLMHRNPEQVAVIGMGSGMSAGMALQFPSVKQVDVIEIEPYVVEAAKYFDKYNFHLLSNPRARIHTEDARNYLLGHEDKYDVIISEPSNHWIAGIANLYSQDFFHLTASRLKPGGIFCQWLQFYLMSPESLRMILATFQSVYPNVHVFLVRTDLFIIGSQTPPFNIDAREIADTFNTDRLEDKFNSIGITFNGIGITAAHYVAGSGEIRRLTAMSRLHTDDHPFLEFNAPFDYFEKQEEIIHLIRDIYPVDVNSRLNLGNAKMTAEDYYLVAREIMTIQLADPSAAEATLKKALELDPKHLKSLDLLARFYEGKNLSVLADRYFKLSLDNGAGADTRLHYIAFLINQKNFEEADKVIQPLLGADFKGNRAQLFELYALLSDGLGQFDRAYEYQLSAAQLTGDDHLRARRYLIAEKFLKKTLKPDPNQQIGILLEAYKLWSTNPDIAYELGSLFLELGDFNKARSALLPAYNNGPNILEINLLLREIESMSEKSGK